MEEEVGAIHAKAKLGTFGLVGLGRTWDVAEDVRCRQRTVDRGLEIHVVLVWRLAPGVTFGLEQTYN